jgi:hypothetical protein
MYNKIFHFVSIYITFEYRWVDVVSGDSSNEELVTYCGPVEP